MGKNWTEIINPSKRLFQLNFIELWRYRDLISLCTQRFCIKVQTNHFRTNLVYHSTHVNNTYVCSCIWKYCRNFHRRSTENTFYYSGLVCWNYFSTCLISTSNVFVANANIFGKVYFPRLSLPISIIISSFIQFIIQFIFFNFYFVFQY